MKFGGLQRNRVIPVLWVGPTSIRDEGGASIAPFEPFKCSLLWISRHYRDARYLEVPETYAAALAGATLAELNDHATRRRECGPFASKGEALPLLLEGIAPVPAYVEELEPEPVEIKIEMAPEPVDDIEGMSLHQLRALAEDKGLAIRGTKRELRDRISAAL